MTRKAGIGAELIWARSTRLKRKTAATTSKKCGKLVKKNAANLQRTRCEFAVSSCQSN